MSLSPEDIEFIKAHLGEWLAEQTLAKPPAVYEIELRERMVRVEEELKHQRDLLIRILEQMDKRFEEMRGDMNKRFEQVDKRFEQVDKRFEQVDKRFEALTQRLDQFMRWSFGVTISTGALVVAILRLTG